MCSDFKSQQLCLVLYRQLIILKKVGIKMFSSCNTDMKDAGVGGAIRLNTFTITLNLRNNKYPKKLEPIVE